MEWNYQPFMRINGYWIDIIKIYFSFNHNLRTKYECSSKSSINMKPYFVFFTNFSYQINWVNTTLNSCSHCSVYKHANIVFMHLFLNTFFKLFRNHSSTLICFYINQIILSNSTEMSSFFHWIMRSLRSKDF